MKIINFIFKNILNKWEYSSRNNGRFVVLIIGCKQGLVAYNFAISLFEYKISQNSRFDFHIICTDTNIEELEFAKKGIYNADCINHLSYEYKKKYFLKHKDNSKKIIRIKPEIRTKVSFRYINFNENFSFRENMDLILLYKNIKIRSNMEKIFKFIDKNGYLIAPFPLENDTLQAISYNFKKIAPFAYKKL